jgi:hypothetical protein
VSEVSHIARASDVERPTINRDEGSTAARKLLDAPPADTLWADISSAQNGCKTAPDLKRSPAGHNPQSKLPVLAKANRPDAWAGGASTAPALHEYFHNLTIIQQLCGSACTNGFKPQSSRIAIYRVRV